MPNTLLVSIPRSDYLSHACSQQAHNDSSHAAIFLLSIVKHPSWSIHRVRVQSGDVWCGGKKNFLSLGVQSFRQPQDPPNRTEADLLLSHQIWWFSTPKIGWLKIHDLPRSSPSKKNLKSSFSNPRGCPRHSCNFSRALLRHGWQLMNLPGGHA
jgi:hypothetical protein